MSTAGGPKLYGIGRGGDSDLVLCMDAHDAGSYPGEPTTNTLLNGYFPGTDTTTVTAGWTLHGSAAKTTYRPAAEEFFYKNLGLSNPRVFQINGGGSHADGSYTRCGMPNPTPGFSTGTDTTVSFWYRFTGQNAAQLSNQKIWVDLDYGLADVYANYTDYNDTEWHLFSATQESSVSYDYYNLYIYAPALSACPGGSYFEIGAFQIEQKGYATPFVGDGQFARPASVNLMIHGNVGTGQTFSDSSPSKHTITAVADVTHSAGQSKFSGGSIYFDGNGDCLSIPDSSDWDFGGGDFTLDAWIYLSNISTYHVIMAQDDNNVQKSWQFRTQVTSGDLLFRYTTNGTTEVDIASSTTGMVINTWYHVAFVRSSNTYAFYVNGVQKGTGSLSATLHNSSAIAVIGSRNGDSLDFEGYMDEVRITKGTALWTSAFTPPTRRNLNAPVVDLSGHDNAGNFATKAMTDVATFRDGQVIEPVASAVWNFDGTDDKITSAGPSFASSSFSEGLSVSTWIKLDSTTMTAADVSFAIRWASGAQNQFAFGYRQASSDKGISLYLWNDSNTQQDNYRTDWNPTAGIWYHVVGVFNPSNYVRIYIDGEIDYERTSSIFTSLNTSSTQDLRISPFDAGSFEGLMGSLHIYEIALTHQQVKQNFNSQRSRFEV